MNKINKWNNWEGTNLTCMEVASINNSGNRQQMILKQNKGQGKNKTTNTLGIKKWKGSEWEREKKIRYSCSQQFLSPTGRTDMCLAMRAINEMALMIDGK